MTMKIIMLSLFCWACAAEAEERYLEVVETIEQPDSPVCPLPTFVRISVTDKADATNKLAEVVAEYFAGIEYTAVYHEHYHGPDVRKPCVIVPLKSSGFSKYVEAYTEPDQYHLPEIIRVGVTDATDADDKAKAIKKSKWFKDKATKTKVKL